MSDALRILFVDDEETVLSSTRDLLRREGYACECASGVAEGLAWLDQNECDLVIADIKMPGNADLEFARRLAARGDGLPIILVTGYPSVASAIESVELPVVAYLVKPFDFQDLLAKVRGAERRVAALRAMRRELTRLQAYRQDLAQAESDLRQLPRAAHAPSLQAFIGMTMTNVVDSLASLRSAVDTGQETEAGDEAAKWPLPVPADMREVLREVVATLERTKHAFKSKELGELRRKLEGLLNV